MTISTDAEKACDNIQDDSNEKCQQRIEGNLFNLIKSTH
jgi:hypothetical protein